MNKRVIEIRNGRLVRDEMGGFYHPEWLDGDEEEL